MKSLDDFLATDTDGYFHIGHASGLLRLKGKLILFDPCWDYRPFSEYWSLVPDQVNCDKLLSSISLCIVSHIHDDHYTDKILSQLKCPVLVMSGRDDLVQKLSGFGANVIEHIPQNSLYLFDGIKCYFLPSSFNKVDSSVFVYSDDFGFYHGNDNFVTSEMIKQALDEIPTVTVATIPYCYLNWYPENMLNLTREQKNSEDARLTKKLLDHAEMLIEELDVYHVIPAAANLYYNDSYDSPFNDQGMTPWEFKFFSRFNDRILTFTPGDHIIFFDRGTRIHIGRTEEQYVAEIEKNLASNKPKGLNAKVEVHPGHLVVLEEKMQKAEFVIPNHDIIFVLDNLYNIVIDTEAGTATLDTEKRFNKNYTMVFIEPYQLMQWLNGEITYEMVVATRKFKMLRTPDIYDVKVFQYMLNYL